MAKRKLFHPKRLPPEFWDGLSKTFFTRNALRELDRRNAQRQEELERIQKQKQTSKAPRRSRRLRTREKTVPTVHQVLAQFSPSSLKGLKKSATHGGPDLTELRGYSMPPSSDNLQSLEDGKRKQKNSETTSSPSTGPFDLNFEQHLVDNSIYPHKHRYPAGHRPPRPANLDEIRFALAQPRLMDSPLETSDKKYKEFYQTDAAARTKSRVITAVLPMLEGGFSGYKDCVGRAKPFVNLHHLTDGTLLPANPDIHYGARPELLAGKIRQTLSSQIVPTQSDGPVASNYFVVARGPRGSAAIAQRQLCYDMALGERGQIALLSHGQPQLYYNHCAHTLGFTYQSGAVRMYAMHALEPLTDTSAPEYIMTLVDTYTMSGNARTFREGIRAFRNAKDWAQEQRDMIIAHANQQHARMHPLTPAAEESVVEEEMWSVKNMSSVGMDDDGALQLNSTTYLSVHLTHFRPPLQTMDDRPGQAGSYLVDDNLLSIAALSVAVLCGIFPTNWVDLLFVFLAFLCLGPTAGPYSSTSLIIKSLLPASLVPVLLYALYSAAAPSSGSADDPAWTGPGRPYLIPCRTTHRRLFPEKHSFSYSYLVVGVPVGFAGNIKGIVSAGLPRWRRRAWFDVDAADYLQRGFGEVGMRGKLDDFLRSQNVDPSDYPHAYLVTAARFLGYHFNPVSFWYLYSADKVLAAMVVEVNNTFGERRPYLVLRDLEADEQVSRIEASWPKDFHVSPFNSRKGTWSVLANDPLGAGMEGFGRLDVTIRLRSSKGHAKIVARLFSEGECVDPSRMSAVQRAAFVASWFWVGFVTLPRIVREAAALYFARGLRVWYRPEPLRDSLGRLADGVETDLERVFRRYLQFLVGESSCLSVTYEPSGIADVAAQVYTSSAGAERLEIRVLTPVFYSRFVQYDDGLEAMLCEMTESGTVWVDKPRLLPALFPSREERSGQQSWSRTGFKDGACFTLIKKLRRRPVPPAVSTLPTMEEKSNFRYNGRPEGDDMTKAGQCAARQTDSRHAAADENPSPDADNEHGTDIKVKPWVASYS
ncbi:hypothetical protein L249_5091 [Ophiocordyceps polyrhachis-furcata BCC 54312]|uniref:Uncharacterized protein n=1 Tax=Ophiocordyceps polyrhachis-furcata BCC 54312 TaxID=1330021 RepID=A0A367L3K8_9HYPO|nr:hypothetical protein L249_5091 [Ophiocordyceps polyrhachis-furcata BCC 54312]